MEEVLKLLAIAIICGAGLRIGWSIAECAQATLNAFCGGFVRGYKSK